MSVWTDLPFHMQILTLKNSHKPFPYDFPSQPQHFNQHYKDVPHRGTRIQRLLFALLCAGITNPTDWRVTIESNALDQQFTTVIHGTIRTLCFIILEFMRVVCDVCINAHNSQPYPRRQSCWRQWVCHWTSSRPQPAWRGGCWRPQQANTADLTHQSSCSVRAGSTQQYLEQPGGSGIGRKYNSFIIFSIQWDMQQCFNKFSDNLGMITFHV